MGHRALTRGVCRRDRLERLSPPLLPPSEGYLPVLNVSLESCVGRHELRASKYLMGAPASAMVHCEPNTKVDGVPCSLEG